LEADESPSRLRNLFFCSVSVGAFSTSPQRPALSTGLKLAFLLRENKKVLRRADNHARTLVRGRWALKEKKQSMLLILSWKRARETALVSPYWTRSTWSICAVDVCKPASDRRLEGGPWRPWILASSIRTLWLGTFSSTHPAIQ
jgi:hypothetical protein